MDDDRERQGGLKGIPRDEVDLGEVLIVFVRAGFCLVPLEDEVGGRDQDHLARVGIERILTGQERHAPYTALRNPHKLSVAVVLPRKVLSRLPGIGDDDADIADLDDGLRDQLHRREQPIDVVGPFHQDLELAPAHAARAQEFFGVLEGVVVALGP